MFEGIENFLSMSPIEFERAITSLVTKMGFRAEHTQACADGGVDIWAVDDRPISGSRIIIQCKRYAPSLPVGEPTIRELYGLVHAHGVNKGVVITTSHFSAGALEFASGKPLELITGIQLLGLFNQHMPEVREIPKRDDSSWRFFDGPNFMNELNAWRNRRPLPYAIRFRATPSEVWSRLDNWTWPPEDDLRTVSGLTFSLTYYGAAYYLTGGAIFRPEDGAVPLEQRILKRLAEVSELLSELEHGGGEKAQSDTPRKAGGLMSGAASKAVTR
jgi:hypothetical protein